MSDERKTPDERQKMSELERIRHSCAHVLATAILRIWPEAQFAYGPPVETGFYYDVLLAHRLSTDDFARIEEEMKKEIKANHPFERRVVSREEARALAESGRLGGLTERGEPSVFKLDLLNSIPDGEEISLFANGDFLDLCAGPHVMRTGNIGAFRLTQVASAYYKGDEKNPQLQRVYGTAFKNKTELEAWFTQLEEAKKRDHRKLGREMELFTFDDDIGPGLPLWLPRGTVLIEELEKLAKETEFAAGYQRVRTPHLARQSMYLTSGHLPYYEESMFPAMELDEDRELRQAAEVRVRETRLKAEEVVGRPLTDDEAKGFDLSGYAPEGQPALRDWLGAEHALGALPPPKKYYLKAMNCPHHHKVFGAIPRSYRDLPLRLAEYGTCYRYEQSGELFGLMRVRAMQMNDAHIYCTAEQFETEFRAVNEMYLRYFEVFGLERYIMRFSTHDPKRLGEKFVNEPELWLQTEAMVRDVLQRSGIKYVEVPNEAAFYGPKIDVQVWSAIGREFTIATNQVDFAVPKRFELTYRDRDNAAKTPLCIHRAPLGTHERFIGFLIEHFAGNFPLWLAPEQVRLLPIGDDPELVAYAGEIQKTLRSHGIRAEMDPGTDKINGKVLRAEEAKVHTMLVIGKRDMESGAVSVRVHGKGNLGARPKHEVVAELVERVRRRELS
jgi:threonyl-tRNA synthetase